MDSVDPVKLMMELVDITAEKWISASRFSGLANTIVGDDVGRRITFLIGVKSIMRELPVQVYSDDDTRQSILNAVQEALDAAISQEEE